MNLEYLGDALDHWKGSLFEYLQSERVVRDLVVDPMATDADQWSDDDFALYACLLRVSVKQIIRHKALLADRSSYFAEIRQSGDLFLDPDTGVAAHGASPIAKYVKPREVAALLQSSRSLGGHLPARARAEDVYAYRRLPSCNRGHCHWRRLVFLRVADRRNALPLWRRRANSRSRRGTQEAARQACRAQGAVGKRDRGRANNALKVSKAAWQWGDDAATWRVAQANISCHRYSLRVPHPSLLCSGGGFEQYAIFDRGSSSLHARL